MPNYPQRMFDAVSEFDAIGSTQGVTDHLAKIFSSFGYTAFLITSVPEPPLKLEPYILVNGWSPGWTEHYIRNDYYKSDPVAAWCRKSTNPFEWREAPYDKEKKSKPAEVMNISRDFGMIEGFLVPIVRSTGFHDCVTMAGRNPDLDPRAKRAIHMISMFAHGRISQLRGETIRKKVNLSRTEREILRWSAMGKTSWEIGQILDLAKSSVDTLANRAAKKLDAVNRMQAVVNAMRIGEIDL
jgi:LuxR family quorum sensing-dependent transcriptional regulator